MRTGQPFSCLVEQVSRIEIESASPEPPATRCRSHATLRPLRAIRLTAYAPVRPSAAVARAVQQAPHAPFAAVPGKELEARPTGAAPSRHRGRPVHAMRVRHAGPRRSRPLTPRYAAHWRPRSVPAWATCAVARSVPAPALDQVDTPLPVARSIAVAPRAHALRYADSRVQPTTGPGPLHPRGAAPRGSRSPRQCCPRRRLADRSSSLSAVPGSNCPERWQCASIARLGSDRITQIPRRARRTRTRPACRSRKSQRVEPVASRYPVSEFVARWRATRARRQ